MRASHIGLIAGLLLALAFLAGGAEGLVIAALFGLIGLVLGALLGGETRSFRRFTRRRRR
ncbi:DUF2273 domain-containing protein [Glycomyces paridis]|uniref:DUF2273 domain-containing protein n=2 Tax=Glycomyces paridis TaxID=2126555 RepID=A0A4S8PJU5_9ACTN|nr:DUF2273 domain-containing protein [Glycomyces paridis]